VATIRVEGLAELGRRLRELPKAIAGKGGGPLRYAIFQAAKVIKAQAIANAPEDTGRLKANIVTARMRKTPEGREGYYIEVRRKRRHYARTSANRRKGRVGKTYETRDAYYGMFIEFGTERNPARPFMRPAFDAKKEQAAYAFRDALKKGIEMAVRKMNK
jgi:HK97 gp10 family phage protein